LEEQQLKVLEVKNKMLKHSSYMSSNHIAKKLPTINEEDSDNEVV